MSASRAAAGYGRENGAARVRIWMRSALLCLGLLGSACADDDDGAGINAALHGTVRDAETGKRLSGVKIEFESDTLEKLSDKTNSHGGYALNVDSATPTGRLTASKAGYETGVVSVFLDDDNVAVDIALMHTAAGN